MRLLVILITLAAFAVTLPLLIGLPTSSAASTHDDEIRLREALPQQAPTPIPLDVVEQAPPEVVARMVDEAPLEERVRLMEEMSVAKAVAVMDLLEPTVAGPIFEQIAIARAAEVMGGMETARASAVMDLLSTARAAEMVGAMELARSADIWSFMQPVRAGLVFDETPTNWATEVVKTVPEERLLPRLPEASATKLWEIPLQVLLDNLPSVHVMHLDFWNQPRVDPGLPEPVGTDLSPTKSSYTLPRVGEGKWALLVGSPVPIERVWGRFRRPQADIQIIVEQLDRKPPDLPDFPAGQVVNTFLDISLENSDPEDLFLAAAVVSVEKSWLDANQVHKWSVQFNRFDEARSAWVPFPTKRVRDDQQRISFAIVVPGFSRLAITGSRALPPQDFSVTDLSISPASPKERDEITISVQVTNGGTSRASYPVNLWLDHFIEGNQVVEADPGQTVSVSFSIRKPEGRYELRVERAIGELTVGPAPDARPPSVGGRSLRPGTLFGLAATAAALLLAGLYILARRQT